MRINDPVTFALMVLGISAGAFALTFWLLMIKDCILEKEGYDRYKWLIVLILIPVIAAIFYFFITRRERAKEFDVLKEDPCEKSDISI